MVSVIIPDTSLLWNFCAVHQLPLVEKFCQGQTTGWADEVQDECDSHELDCEAIEAIFGKSVAPTREQERHALRLRTQYFSGQVAGGVGYLSKDRGECITLAIWAVRGDDADPIVVLTEDISVVRFCLRSRDDRRREFQEINGRKLIPVTTEDLLDRLIARDLGLAAPRKPPTPAAFNLVKKNMIKQQLAGLGRPWIGRACDIEI